MAIHAQLSPSNIFNDNCVTVFSVNWRREVDTQNDEAMPHMDYKNFEYSSNTVLH